MSRVDAVVLAAGRGSRLGPKGEVTPKALLPLGDRGDSFLRRLTTQLVSSGVDRVVVVVGHLAECFEPEVARWGLPVTLVENPEPLGASGSLRSLQCAVNSVDDLLDGSAATIVTDADILCHEAIVASAVAAAGQTTVVVSETQPDDDEAVLVWGTAEHPRFLGKGLRPELTGGSPCLGEAVGMLTLGPADHALAESVMTWLLRFGPARALTEHEELSGRLMQLGRMRALTVSAALPFLECDDADDYARAQALYAANGWA